MERKIHTIGHSTHTIEHFVNLLTSFSIDLLVDVRRYPGSRRYPHFGSTLLSRHLHDAGIRYIHMEPLGGRRTPTPNSPNSGWRNASFRGYADYMSTDAFQAALLELERQAGTNSAAIMCSEAVWWSCHRSLIADYLKWKGWEVLHILGEGKSQPHPYTAPARPTKEALTYQKAEELF